MIEIEFEEFYKQFFAGKSERAKKMVQGMSSLTALYLGFTLRGIVGNGTRMGHAVRRLTEWREEDRSGGEIQKRN